MQIIGEKLMNYKENGYVLPFEVISILLLAAMVSAIVVAKRTKTKNDV
jgi:NADH-quinone oxidoreductase subunit J